MPDAVRELYSQHRYPALSHPETHPGLLAATARCAGLPSPPLAESCRVLDVGCASGLNLLPMAARFPESQFHGIDFSDTAIRHARHLAGAAGLKNVTFEHADLTEWQPAEEYYDYIIAHGMLSWVPDVAKAALFKLIQHGLAPDGIVCIGYNTLPGWSLRQEAAAMVKALPDLGDDVDSILETLATAAEGGGSPYSAHLAAIYRDMQRKGTEIIAFDDLGPVCDPHYFGQVLQWAGDHKLRYLGESNLWENLPAGIGPAALEKLQPLASDPVRYQQTLDMLSGRTHRSSLFCRSDLALDTATTTSVTLHFSVRQLVRKIPPKAIHGEVIQLFHAALALASPASRRVPELMEECAQRLGSRWDPERGAKTIADWLYQAARLGWVELRADDLAIPSVTPARPTLSPLNLELARHREALVDACHRSCRFPEGHWPVVAVLDGSRSTEEIVAFARDHAPDLDVIPWLAHLSERGLLSVGDSI